MNETTQVQKSKSPIIFLMGTLIVVQAIALGFSLIPSPMSEIPAAVVEEEESHFKPRAQPFVTPKPVDAGPKPESPASVEFLLTETPVM